MAVLTPQEMLEYAQAAGFSGDAAARIIAIAKRESGWNTNAYNGDESTGDNSVGLTQINMIGQLGVNRLSEINRLFGTSLQNVDQAKQWLKDPVNNLKYAYYISGGGQDWQPWTTAQGAFAGTDLTEARALVGSGATATGTSNGRALTSAGVSLLPNNAGVKLDMPDGTTQQYDPADITDALIAQMANELGQLSINSPTVKDYATQNLISPAQALSELRLNGLTQLQSLETSAQQLRMYKNGFVADPTGKYIISVNSLDPQARAQADAINQQTWTGIQNTYLKDQYGLNADRITSLFNSQVAGVNSSLSYDQNALTRANSLINRQLAGKQEADARAKFVTDTLTSLAPWATGGKTEFTGNDFGAIGAEFAKAAGMDPNATALKFPGSVTVNPSSLLDLYDQQMGTSGPLPSVPEMLTNPSLLGQISGGMSLPPTPSLFGASPIPAATGPQTTDLDSLLNQFATAGKGPTTVLPGSNFNISSLLQALKGFGG